MQKVEKKAKLAQETTGDDDELRGVQKNVVLPSYRRMEPVVQAFMEAEIQEYRLQRSEKIQELVNHIEARVQDSVSQMIESVASSLPEQIIVQIPTIVAPELEAQPPANPTTEQREMEDTLLRIDQEMNMLEENLKSVEQTAGARVAGKGTFVFCAVALTFLCVVAAL